MSRPKTKHSGLAPTQGLLHELFSYDQETGLFTRLVSVGGSAKVGSIAGRSDSHGAIQIGVGGKKYLAHRLVWLYVYGRWPTSLIDHKNLNPSDNRLCNLREATHYENQLNKDVRVDSVTGSKNVYTKTYKGKQSFSAYGKLDGKRKSLGTYPTLEDASRAYQAFAAKHHGEFYREGL